MTLLDPLLHEPQWPSKAVLQLDRQMWGQLSTHSPGVPPLGEEVASPPSPRPGPQQRLLPTLHRRAAPTVAVPPTPASPCSRTARCT